MCEEGDVVVLVHIIEAIIIKGRVASSLLQDGSCHCWGTILFLMMYNKRRRICSSQQICFCIHNYVIGSTKANRCVCFFVDLFLWCLESNWMTKMNNWKWLMVVVMQERRIGIVLHETCKTCMNHDLPPRTKHHQSKTSTVCTVTFCYPLLKGFCETLWLVPLM